VNSPARVQRRHFGVAIVGPGRIGLAIGRLLKEAGADIRFVAARRPAAARRAVRFIGAGEPIALFDPRLRDAKTILLTTADAALREVARALAGRSNGPRAWRSRVVLHTCGSLPASVLRPLKLRGAAIGSLHPFQTVPNPSAGLRNLRGCYWCVEGDPAAQRVARRWVKALKGTAFHVHSTQRALYHLSAFLVSPTVVVLMERSARLLRRAGVPGKVAGPMLRQFVTETVRNFATLGAKRALTGPVVRGDWATVERHLSALREVSPDLVPLYKEFLSGMLRLAKEQKAESRKQKTAQRRRKDRGWWDDG